MYIVNKASTFLFIFLDSSVIMTMSGRKEVVRMLGGIVVGGESEYL